MSPSELTDEDIAASLPTPVIRMAGGALAFAGVIGGLTGVQALTGLVFHGALWLLPSALVALSLAALGLGTQVTKARFRALVAGLAAGAFLLLIELAWFMTMLASAGISMLALMALPVTGSALLLLVLAFTPCRRAEAARQKLEQAGLLVSDRGAPGLS